MKVDTMSKKGFLVSFEGVECTGKSTQVKLLKEYCERKGIPAIMTREPGGSPYAENIRNVILHDEHAGEASALTMFLLFWAARADHIQRTVIPAIERGSIVITDRFDGTSFSHQLYGQEAWHLEEYFFQTRRVVLDTVAPHLYIILNMEPEKSLARLAARRNEPQNHFDKRELAFHERVREGCLEFAKLFPSIVIDADREKMVVHEDIVGRLYEKGIL